ncbi:MAG: hypothetical protein Q9217_001498 [Psora testacea]
MHSSIVTALAALAVLLTPTAAHSWVEELTLIDSTGTFTGTPGYARNFTARTTPGFTDTLLVHILPPSDPLEARDVDTESIKPTDAMCRKSQQQQYQSDGFPRLSAAPGSMIALRYKENGHVTLPQNQPGKPANRGNVSIYGTTQPKPNENFLDVFKQWNEAGTGGDKRGKLLATQPFDDGQCYQVNGGDISKSRQQQHPHPADKVTGEDLWCQNDIKLPSDVPTGKPYALYWVWNWPTEPGVDPGLPKGKAEIYTSCMDIDVKAGSQSRSLNEARDVSGQNFNNMAIPSYMSLMNQPAASSAPPAQPAPSESTNPAPLTANLQQKQEAKGAQSTQPAPSTPTAVAAASGNTQVQNPPTTTTLASQNIGSPPAESLVLSLLGPQLVSQIAAEAKNQAAAEATVTETVTQASAVVETPSAQNSAALNSGAHNPVQDAGKQSPAAPNTATRIPSTATAAAASPSVVSGMPPTSLNVASPILSPTSGGTPASVAPTQSHLPTFEGIATPAASTQGNATTNAGGKRSCGAGTCRKMKRSRIFGSQK